MIAPDQSIYNFRVIKRSASYVCKCAGCGKEIARTASVEHTVNPFNTNAEGIAKTPAEVSASAQLAANDEAARLATAPALCRSCEEAPNLALLTRMAAEPARVFQAPEKFWASPMHTLQDRKQVEAAHEQCRCGSPCCSGWRSLGGYRITQKGRARAAKLPVQPDAEPADAEGHTHVSKGADQ